VAQAIVRLASGSFDRFAHVGASHPGSYAASLLLVGLTVGAAEVHFADFEHGTHLLVLLAVVVGIALIRGTGPALAGLLAGGVVSGVTSLGTVEPAGHPDAVVQLTMYVVVGVTFLLLASLASEARRRRRLSPAPVAATGCPLPRPAELLTEREQEVLCLAARGVSVDEIARCLYLSPNTVKTHLTHVYAKLGARGRSDAIRMAIHLRYLNVDDICPHRGLGETAFQGRP
jgi:DNA-binding CsgD family transcriptional regulator